MIKKYSRFSLSFLGGVSKLKKFRGGDSPKLGVSRAGGPRERKVPRCGMSQGGKLGGRSGGGEVLSRGRSWGGWLNELNSQNMKPINSKKAKRPQKKNKNIPTHPLTMPLRGW